MTNDQAMAYTAPARKRPIYKRVWFWFLIIVVVIAVTLITSIANAVDKGVNAAHTVTYDVTSDASTASVTYTQFNGNGTNGSEQANEAPVPFTKTVQAKGNFSAYSLVAQASPDATTITCKVTVDGKVKSQQTSTGPSAVVTCAANGS